MKRRFLALLLAACMTGAVLGGCSGADSDSTETQETTEADNTEEDADTAGDAEDAVEPYEETVEEGQILLPAADAVFTEGEGVGPDDETIPTAYDAVSGQIIALATGTEVEYTVPEGVDGSYDLYLRVSKCLSGYGSMPFTFSINGGEEFSVPIAFQVPEDSPAAYTKDGEGYDVGKLTDSGHFPIEQNLTLKTGDTIKVTAAFGSRAGNLSGIVFPQLGSMMLAPAGSEVATGYDDTVKKLAEADPSDPLSGLHIVWLGSSVTYGAKSGGYYSMADAIADNHPGTVCDKYAVSATTLVNSKEDSYVERMKLIPKNTAPDLFVVQLSTNDATTGKPYGELTDSFDPATFDDTTIIGAIETIIDYVKNTFGCPVVFYTGTYYESEEYAQMVEALLKIQEKWGIGVVDMFHNEEMTAVYGTEQYDAYMSDDVHPYRAGYVEWWTPVIEKYLTEYLQMENQ